MSPVPSMASVVAVVAERVAALRGESPSLVARRIDADLGAELGLDSLQMLGLYVTIEEQFGLAAGHLGVAQSVTIRSVAADVCQLLSQPAEEARC